MYPDNFQSSIFNNTKTYMSEHDLPSNLLFLSNSEYSANILYFTGFYAMDPFIAFSNQGTRYCVLNTLEYGRGLKEAQVDIVLCLDLFSKASQAQFQTTTPSLDQYLVTILQAYGIDSVTVEATFPLQTARFLENYGIHCHCIQDGLLPTRILKSKEQASAIEASNAIAQAGFRAAERILTESAIINDQIIWEQQVVTAELLQTEIEIACLRAGGQALKTIVACGIQACDPHCTGSGPIIPHELIVIDIFPRSKTSYYYGDMTRTFLKGTPSAAHIKLVETVLEAQKVALSLLKDGIDGSDVDANVCSIFDSRGYKTIKNAGICTGFIHSTGHGLGLELHEFPTIGTKISPLQTGMVITIEPGLYYPEIGGARIEDVVWITPDGYQLLSHYHYNWIID